MLKTPYVFFNETTQPKVGEKEDELCSLICNLLPSNFTAGTENYSLDVVSYTNENMQLRQVIILAINIDGVKSGEKRLENLYKVGELLAKANNCEYMIILFNNCNILNKQDPATAKFYLFKDKCAYAITGNEYRDMLYVKLGVNETDKGTTKIQNDHICNYHHFWTRSFLTKNLCICDIDAAFFNDRMVIPVEIKRSDIENLEDKGCTSGRIWKEYAADVNSYSQYERISKRANPAGIFVMFLHEKAKMNKICNEKSIIKCFCITEVDREIAHNICKSNRYGSAYYLKNKETYTKGCYLTANEAVNNIMMWLERH